jgi:hypothetical protein
MSSDSVMDVQRKRKTKGREMKRVSERIPKCPKTHDRAWNLPKACASRSDGGASYDAIKKYRNNTSRSSPSTEYYHGPFASYQERGMHFSCRENRFSHYYGEEEQQEKIREDICLSVVLHRHKLWQRFLEYEPTTKCRPTDTYLVIIVGHEARIIQQLADFVEKVP